MIQPLAQAGTENIVDNFVSISGYFQVFSYYCLNMKL